MLDISSNSSASGVETTVVETKQITRKSSKSNTKLLDQMEKVIKIQKVGFIEFIQPTKN